MEDLLKRAPPPLVTNLEVVRRAPWILMARSNVYFGERQFKDLTGSKSRDVSTKAPFVKVMSEAAAF